MRIGTFGTAAGVLALGLAAWITPAIAQGPLWDVVKVNMPYTVTIGDKQLQPGDYTIQQFHDTGGGSRILLIYSDNGMKFETSAMTIPALDPNTARETKVMLHHFGNDYYFDKIWIQGKDYGYEFPLPNSVKSRQREAMAPVAVAANYSTMPAQENSTSSTTTEQSATQSATTQRATTQRATTQRATTQRATTQQATTQQATTQPQTATQQPQTATMQQQTTAQATTGRATTSRATTARATTAQATNGNANGYNGNGNGNDNNNNNNSSSRRMPKTSAGWLMMLLGGSGLSSLGLALRRQR
jgi:hypothetical protein